MEFVEGVKVTDLQALEEMGVEKRDVARVVVDIFSEQIHLHGTPRQPQPARRRKLTSAGFIHCDPHPGNLLVRRMDGQAKGKAGGKPQIVLLDHGLYRELSEDFRKNYCHLWKALVLRDEEKIVDYCSRLGAGRFADLFSIMLTLRPAGNKKRLNSKFSRNDVNELKEIVRGAHEQFSEMLKEMDRDLLMVLRTT